ncbi:MAG: DNA polymerase Y family protein [Acidimicrobiales bacterium]
MSSVHSVRTLVVWCPDWPVVAAGVPPDEPAAVLHTNRVVAASPAARAEGVAPGMRRREAQTRCPALAVLDHDPARDTRAFEPVVAALEALTPRIEISEPGRCCFPTRGPSRYFGGDEALAARARARAASAAPPGTRIDVGVADGRFPATVAARQAASTGAVTPLVVPPRASPEFLAPLPRALLTAVLDPDTDPRPLADLLDVLGRLGLRTLGDLAALPAADVVARFGALGVAAHRLASGDDGRPPDTRPPPPELAVGAELDPPIERVDTAAFVARSLADELHGRLADRGLACTRVVIVAETEHGERLERMWRHEGALSAGAVADRVRWQLDGWLNGSSLARPTLGITLLRLVPDEVRGATGRQLGFWGGDAWADERVARAVARLQGLLGPEAVTVPEWRGGRAPGERVAMVPAATLDLDAHRPTTRPESIGEPWPGRIPDPSPATLHPEPIPVEVTDAAGRPLLVSGRGVASAPPARVAVAGGPWRTVAAWAGPWPADERWWDPADHRRRARFQVRTDDGIARLLTLEGGRWWVEATYD